MPTLIVVAGPTASGKTNLSIELAKAYNAEIISADARQFYRGLNIGTAKPNAVQLTEVKHHFIDFIEPTELYNAGKFEQDALRFLESYFQENDVCVMVGGSGMYLNAVTEGFDPLPSSPPAIRQKFNDLFDELGLEHLQNLLKTKDPEYFQEVDIFNRQRVQRALEAIDVSGVKFSEMRTNNQRNRSFNCVKIALMPDRNLLYNRINNRVDEMIENGLVEEVRSFMPIQSANALQTVGYKELFDHFNGVYSLNEALDKIKQHTRNYAKRQFTWFKKQEGYIYFDSNEFHPIKRHLDVTLNV